MGMSFSRASASERALARLGAVVQQKYRIDRLIGVGGTAAVYAATHRNGHRVAIKFLHENFWDDREICQLFSREAYVANQVGHTGAVPVLDDDVDEEGCPFLIMPLLEGRTLLARWEGANRRLPIDEVAVVISDALEVLVSAHAKGIIHRDIKPDNLFIITTGNVRVLDFGIARRINSDSSTTFTGRMVGTPAFMPPEQALGERDSVGPHSDCWAMGATIFTLLSGELVHVASTSGEQLAAAATRIARSLADVSPGFPSAIVEFVGKSLAFDPAHRWRSAREMRDGLHEAYATAFGKSVTSMAARMREELATELSPASVDSHATITQPADRLRPAAGTAAPPMLATGSTDPGAGFIGAREVRVSDSPEAQSPRAHEPIEPIPMTLREGETPSSDKRNEPLASLRSDSARVVSVRSRRRALPVMLAGIALPGVVALAFVVAMVTGIYDPAMSHRLAARLPTVARDGAVEITSSNAEAGIQDWRDAVEGPAQKSFTRALELDPSLAVAHLYLAMIPMWTDAESREHHHAASAQRSRLGSRDRALLDAYGPVMAVPPDFDTAVRRLVAAQEAFPSDWLVSLALASIQIKRGELRNAIQVLDDLSRRDPSAAIAWADKGLAFGLLDDVKSARDSLKECLRISTYGVRCLETLTKLDANEGRCVDSERYGRELMALPSPSTQMAVRLAGAIQGRGGTMASVHDVLERAWQLAPESRREILRQRYETQFLVLAGKFEPAERVIDAWGKAIAGESSETEHSRVAQMQFQIAMELGDRPLAARLASEYLAKRDAWLASTYYDFEIDALRTQYLAGTLSRGEFETRRQAWLARDAQRSQLVSSSALRWTAAYALAVATPDDAKEALRVLPNYLPIVDSLTRDVEVDGAIGFTYLVAGDVKEALPYLERGAHSCNAVHLPIEHTRANLHLGMALEQRGDVAGACAAYGVVLARWGEEHRSVSANAARAHRSALHCPTPK